MITVGNGLSPAISTILPLVDIQTVEINPTLFIPICVNPISPRHKVMMSSRRNFMRTNVLPPNALGQMQIAIGVKAYCRHSMGKLCGFQENWLIDKATKREVSKVLFENQIKRKYYKNAP